MTGEGKLESIEELLERLRHAGNGNDRVTVADIVDEIGDDAFPPLLLVPCLILISPASAVPGLSTVGGMIIALIASQMVLGVKALWLPGFLRRRGLEKQRLDKALDFLQRPARIIDRFTKRRFAWLTAWPLRLIPASFCLLAALVIPFFELVPMSSTIIASAIALFALALLTRDGLLVFFGMAVLAGASTLIWNIAT